MLRLLAMIVGVLFCGGVMLDAFQTIILPRRPSGRFRITRLFYITTWTPWVALGQRFQNPKQRESFYGVFGPLSLLFLLILWATLLAAGFGLVLFGLGTPYTDSSLPPGHHPIQNLRTDLYVSGTTLTTLGPGDVIPRRQAARLVMILESGTGLGFVALVISYVPVLYGAFSRREVSVALLDSRAGSPPTAAELLTRHGFEGGEQPLIALLEEWERWSAEILESHISYPLLCYYRSQHDNQSWLSALTTILDSCALLITTIEGPASRQAQLTFGIARHAVVDLGHVFKLEAREQVLLDVSEINRLPDDIFRRLCTAMADVDIKLCADSTSYQRLLAIRQLYEPEVYALSEHLCMPLPLWISEPKPTDQWRKIASLRSGTPESVLANAHHLSSNSTAANLNATGAHEL